MDEFHFDLLTRKLSQTVVGRRGALLVFAGGLTAAGLGRLGRDAAAAVCRDIGKRCSQNADCCSLRCRGKRGRKKCQVGADACPISAGCPSPVCGTEPGGGDCACKPTIEGNNACTGFISTCAGLPACTSTAQCVRDRGPRFVCQAATPGCGCGQVCVPLCEG
jgi:hypothetical protein